MFLSISVLSLLLNSPEFVFQSLTLVTRRMVQNGTVLSNTFQHVTRALLFGQHEKTQLLSFSQDSKRSQDWCK